jgi:hypothetical protein
MQLAHHPPYIETLLKNKLYRLYFGDDIETSLELLETLFE